MFLFVRGKKDNTVQWDNQFGSYVVMSQVQRIICLNEALFKFTITALLGALCVCVGKGVSLGNNRGIKGKL